MLDKLHPSGEDLTGACWHLSAMLEPSDPVELVDMRSRMRARLARYGRQDWCAWDDRPTAEMDRAFVAVMDLVSKEADSLDDPS